MIHLTQKSGSIFVLSEYFLPQSPIVNHNNGIEMQVQIVENVTCVNNRATPGFHLLVQIHVQPIPNDNIEFGHKLVDEHELRRSEKGEHNLHLFALAVGDLREWNLDFFALAVGDLWNLGFFAVAVGQLREWNLDFFAVAGGELREGFGVGGLGFWWVFSGDRWC